jgi:hypothetical protein
MSEMTYVTHVNLQLPLVSDILLLFIVFAVNKQQQEQLKWDFLFFQKKKKISNLMKLGGNVPEKFMHINIYIYIYIYIYICLR